MATLASTAPSLSASLIQALAGDEPESALEQAFVQLGRGGDLPLLLAMVKALVRVGLAGIAARLLHAGGEMPAAGPQIAGLAAQLQKLPSGELPRELLLPRLATRRVSLVAAHPHLAEVAAALDPSFHVFRSARGNLHAVRDAPDRRLDMVFSFADHQSRARSLRLPPAALGTSFLLVGVPSPPLWNLVVEQRTIAGYVPPIDLVEEDPGVFALWLTMLDDAAALASPRCACFVGSDAVVQYREYLATHAWRSPATQVITTHRPNGRLPAVDKTFLEPATTAIEVRQRLERQRMHARYAGNTAEFWRNRYATAGASSPPLRLVGFTTRYSTVIQHAMADLAAAFRRQGCEFDLVKQPSEHCPVVDVTGTLADSDYDGIVVIDHLRFEFGDSMPAGVPYVCWVQDHMDQLSTRQAGQSVGTLDLVICHAPHVMASLHGYPLERMIGTNNLTDAATYSNEPLPQADLRPHRCDVSFASHGSGTPEELVEEIVAGAPTTFRVFLDQFLHLVRQRLEQSPWINSQELVSLMLRAELESRHPTMTPEIRRTRIYPQLARIYDRVFRHQAIEWTATWARSRNRRFRLYGQGWERHPTFAPFAVGQVASGRDLRAVYQASAVSLQVNGYSSLHQRLLDGVAAGGFVLSRQNPADFVRGPFVAIQSCIREHGFTTLKQLLEHRTRHAGLDAACGEAERLTSLSIRAVGDRRRDAHIAALREGNAITDLMTDEGLFLVLKDLRLIPQRVAADIPGFTETTFGSEQQLHALLDRYVDDAFGRSSVAGPMRDSVIVNDTYDGLVCRMLEAFGAPVRIAPGGSR